MTISELQAKRAEILNTVGLVRVQFGQRSDEFSKQADALAVIDREIARLESPSEDRTFVVQTNRGFGREL
jgi:hypothetical protein